MKSYFFLLSIILLFISCDKDENTPQTLPEATQTGRGIFACYVDGKPFIDNSGSPNTNSFNCFYQYIDGGYYFGISSQDNVNIDFLNTIRIGSDNTVINEGMTYNLVDFQPSSIWGSGGFTENINNYESTYTSSNYTGELHITKFDLQNQIVSGTFWFDIQNPFSGKTVKITEGRFDTHFGQ